MASNDLYGSFCRVRVTLQSDDKRIQDAINSGADWSTAYFAAGDAFTCGSWIPNDKLETLAKQAGDAARDAKKAGQQRAIIEPWAAVAGILGGGAGGAYLGAGIQDGSVFSGLTGKSKKDTKELTVKNCNNYYNMYTNAVADVNSRATVPTHVNNLIDLVDDNDDDNTHGTAVSNARQALTKYQDALAAAGMKYTDQYGDASKRECTAAEKIEQANEKVNEYIRTKFFGVCNSEHLEFEEWRIYCTDRKYDGASLEYFKSQEEEKRCCGGDDNTNYKEALAKFNDYMEKDPCSKDVAPVVTTYGSTLKANAQSELVAKQGKLTEAMGALQSACKKLADADSDEQAKNKRAARG